MDERFSKKTPEKIILKAQKYTCNAFQVRGGDEFGVTSSQGGYVTRGGRGVKKLEIWGDVIYGWSLKQIH